MAISDKNRKQLDEFISLISKMEVSTFLGLAQVLNVSTFDKEKLDERGNPSPKDAVVIVEECIQAFGVLNNHSRRELMKLLRRAVK